MNVYRQLVYQSCKKLSGEEINQVKYYLKQKKLIDNSLACEDTDAIKICQYLEEEKLVSEIDVTLFIEIFTAIHRSDIAKDLQAYQSQFTRFSLFWLKISKTFIFGFPKRTVFILLILLVGSLEICIGTTSVGIILYDNIYLTYFVVIVVAVSYNYADVVREYYRYLRCTYGCVKGSVMSYEFTGLNYVTSDVVGNVEFTWKSIKERCPYLKKHPDIKMHYFLNTNRCILGYVRSYGDTLSSTKPVRGAEVLCVPESGDAVWYFDESKKTWVKYKSARNIRWTKIRSSMQQYSP